MKNTLTSQQQRLLSQILSHALRHEPWLYELELDDMGWVGLDELLRVINATPDTALPFIEVADVESIISLAEKQRHEIAGGRIRALYGHSLPGLIAREEFVPVEDIELYHATSPDAVNSIVFEGLLPMTRQYVHLSPNREIALEVGRRKSEKPVLLRVSVAVSLQAGNHFFRGNDKVILADKIDPKAISLIS
tara:strand:+ start:494 stop:1069 length:576 start_codon:yes stop_codon:yes gene_type:complete